MIRFTAAIAAFSMLALGCNTAPPPVGKTSTTALVSPNTVNTTAGTNTVNAVIPSVTSGTTTSTLNSSERTNTSGVTTKSVTTD